MKLWLARDIELDMIEIYTKEPLWDGFKWDQDSDYCAALIPDDAEIVFKEVPIEHELIEIEVAIGELRIIKPPNVKSTNEEES
jgi:hypothetical protein